MVKEEIVMQGKDASEVDIQLIEKTTVGAYSKLLYTTAFREQGISHELALTEMGEYIDTFIRRVLFKKGLTAEDLGLSTDDLHQETMLRLQGIEVQEPRYFLSFLQHIVNSVIIDAIRKYSSLGNRQLYLNEIELEYDLLHNEENTDLRESESKKLLTSILQRCLKPGKGQEVTYRFLVLDNSVAEIAQSMNLTPLQVTQYKYRALQKLRHCADLIKFFEGTMP